MKKLTSEEIKCILEVSLKNALGSKFGKLTFLSQSKLASDGVSVYQLHNNENQLDAIVLCSPLNSPNLVMRTVQRSTQAKNSLDLSTGNHIQEPLFEGEVENLTYSVWPLCYELSKSRLYRKAQNNFLKPVLFNWLFNVTKCTVDDKDQTSNISKFILPLEYIASSNVLNDKIRMKALFALERISTKEWQPKHVLMHGDLWLGNILLKKNPNILNTLKPYDNFVVTDWAGSEVKGYAMYDLIRFAESTNLSSKKIKFEIERHCKLLNCNPVDACSYLLAGLGFIGMNLENFPLNRFISMSESCFLTLSKSLDSRINGLSFD